MGLRACVLASLASWIGGINQDQPPTASSPPTAAFTHEVVRVSSPQTRSAVETSVAINPNKPNHIIAVALGPVPGSGTSDFAFVSEDGGHTWKTVALPNPSQRTQGDDSIAFSADGTALHMYISFTGIRVARPAKASTGIFLSTSRDGLAWTDPTPVVDQLNTVTPYWDKPCVAVDAVADSPHKGNIYSAFTRFDEYGSKDPALKTHIYFSRSKDGGKSFSVPFRISEQPGGCLDDSKTVMGAVTAVGTKGEVHVIWAGPQGLVHARSTDGGWTFGKNQVITDMPGGWDFPIKGLGRCNGLPSASVDRSPGPNKGTLYVNWADRRHGDPDIFVAASRDGGATWEAPVRVNDDPKGNGREQFFAWMALDPEDGSVNVIYYDRRDDAETKTKLTLARSVDGGRTFANYPVNQPAFAIERRGFFGDYCGIDARGGKVIAVYPHYDEKNQIAVSAALFQFPFARNRP
jgi:hypothetical protein